MERSVRLGIVVAALVLTGSGCRRPTAPPDRAEAPRPVDSVALAPPPSAPVAGSADPEVRAVTPTGTGSSIAIHVVPASETDEPPGFAFAGDVEGRVVVEPLDASDRPPSRNHRVRVAFADGRSLSARVALGERFDHVEAISAVSIVGRADAFVVLIGRARGEDCFESETLAYLVDTSPDARSLVSLGPIGTYRNAFDACVDVPSFAFAWVDGELRATRTTRRVVRDEADDPESRSTRARIDRDRAALAATHRAEFMAAREAGESDAAIEARRSAQADALRAFDENTAFEAGRPYVLCGFRTMSARCDVRDPLVEELVLRPRR